MKEHKALDRVTLVMGYECNLNCSYCPVHNLNYLRNPLSLSEWSWIIEKLVRSFNEDIPFFLSGGEPTFNFGLVNHVVSTLSKYNRKTILITNATLLNKNKIKKLTENKLSGLQVTFHFYYFKDVEKMRKELKRVLILLTEYKKLSSGVTALSVNINTERDFLILEQLNKIAVKGYLNEIDILELSLLNEHVKISPSNSYLKNLREYTEVEVSNYERNDAELREIAITPDGFVIPMETIYPLMLKDRTKSKIFKNIRESDFNEILNLENLTVFEDIIKNWKE
ncbi:MAG: hypothetical protein AMDU4_FER2C00175G0022 [Ferroplasma sp. Type II]|uniref:radical SAM protein n=1 Tax=Ferroplasma sp. Type II TaxID=261388 RepID=UPI00038947C3|nr:radical SAM protein [Ferroplasma sp. Type II]EQB71761.1 MAG: hypothetical protein AMDU4_FER2C00175G0022 [Ferroplasma sp. Type II]